MSHNRLPFFLTVLFLFSCSASGKLSKQTPPGDTMADLPHQVDVILQDSVLQQTRTGIKVVSLNSGKVLYARDSQLLFHPASNMKLLTTATALTKLGPNFKFKTILYANNGSIADTTLAGDLYLKGFGNPDLTTDNLRWMVQQLSEKGIRKITGNLICDESYFDDLYWGSGWMWDDVSSWYWAPIGALTVNDNCVTITVKPGAAVGDSLWYWMDPNTSYMQIENLGATVDSTDSTRLKEFNVERKWRDRENTITIEGGLSPQSGEDEFVIDVVEPGLYAGTLLTELLHEEGISFSGQVMKGVVPDSATELVKHLSPPLTLVVLNTNKISDNLSAEMLLKTVGAEVKGVPGTANKGVTVLNEFFSEMGVDTTAFEVVDGSGVSRYDVVAPDHIIELLKAMHANFRVQAEFEASLPIAGVDGTLKNRMKKTPAEGKLRAKTGSLRGVSALSGFTTTGSGDILAFSIIMEHFLVSTSKIRQVQDRIGALISGVQ